MKRVFTAVALLCFVAFQAYAQTDDVNKLLKIAEDKVKAADQNQTDAVKQLEAAQALVPEELGDKADYDRSITYAEKAVKIIEAQPVLKDTLLAKSYQMLGTLNLRKMDTEKAADYYEKAIEAYERELGRLNPVTIGMKFMLGENIAEFYSWKDSRRGFLHVLEAFYDNDRMPEDKRIQNMGRANVVLEASLERLIASFTNIMKNCLPHVMYDSDAYFIVQTHDWNIEKPIVGWLAANMLRSEEERKAHGGEDIILMHGNSGEFRRLTKEEGQKMLFQYSFRYFPSKPLELQVEDTSAGLLFFPPEVFDDFVKRYKEFKAR